MKNFGKSLGPNSVAKALRSDRRYRKQVVRPRKGKGSYRRKSR